MATEPSCGPFPNSASQSRDQTSSSPFPRIPQRVVNRASMNFQGNDREVIDVMGMPRMLLMLQ